MKLTLLLLVRNEEWCLKASLPAALEFVDEVLAVDHRSTDATPDILHSFGNAVVYERVEDEHFREMDFRRILLHRARMRGATHLVTMDADEIITGNFLPRMREFALELAPRTAFTVPMVACWRSLDAYRSDRGNIFGRNSMLVMVADHPALDWAPRENGYQLHSRMPRGVRSLFAPYGKVSQGGCFHFQWAHWDRLLWKQRHYVLRDLLDKDHVDEPRVINERYHQSVDEAGLETTPVPDAWWAPYASLKPKIDLALPGWHREACLSMVKKIPPERLAEVDLFGWNPTQEKS